MESEMTFACFGAPFCHFFEKRQPWCYPDCRDPSVIACVTMLSEIETGMTTNLSVFAMCAIWWELEKNACVECASFMHPKRTLIKTDESRMCTCMVMVC